MELTQNTGVFCKQKSLFNVYYIHPNVISLKMPFAKLPGYFIMLKHTLPNINN